MTTYKDILKSFIDVLCDYEILKSRITDVSKKDVRLDGACDTDRQQIFYDPNSDLYDRRDIIIHEMIHVIYYRKDGKNHERDVQRDTKTLVNLLWGGEEIDNPEDFFMVN